MKLVQKTILRNEKNKKVWDIIYEPDTQVSVPALKTR